MPVYDVRAEELDGTVRRFEWKEPAEVGDYIRESMTTYRVALIRPDETGRYDAIIEAQWRIAPPQTDS